LGYESAEAMAAAIVEGVNGIDDECNAIGENLVGYAKTAFDKVASDGLFEGFTLEQTNQMSELFKGAFENGGKEGVDSLTNILDTMFDSAGEDADEMAGILGGIDWQTTNVNELSEILEATGIETDGFTDELTKLIDLMKEGQNIGFDAAAEHYSSMKDFAKLKEDDSIEQADIDLLEAAGVDTSRFFKLMGDGSY
jgi:hypothetical protein